MRWDRPLAFARRHPTLLAAVAAAVLIGLAIRIASPPAPAVKPPPKVESPSEAALPPGAPAAVPGPATLRLPAPGGDFDIGSCTQGTTDQPVALNDVIESKISALATRLESQSAAQERALGLYLKMSTTADAARLDYADRNPGCLDDTACRIEADRLANDAARPSEDALARLASSTTVPAVYELALLRCQGAGADAANDSCALLSPAQWAHLDPDNAMPWLAVAADAATRGEASTRDDAFFHASRATSYVSYRQSFATLLQSDAVQSETPEAQGAITIGLVGIMEAVPWRWPQALLPFCSVNAVTDPNRRQVCSDLGQMLIDRGSDLVDLAVGARIGERVGWDTDRLRALRDRRQALMQLAGDGVPKTLDCEGLRASAAWGRESIQTGEVPMLERKLAATGLSAAQFVDRWRAAQPVGADAQARAR